MPATSEHLRIIWCFDRITWPQIEAARLEHGPNVPVIRLRSRREVTTFLALLRAEAIPSAAVRSTPGAAETRT